MKKVGVVLLVLVVLGLLGWAGYYYYQNSADASVTTSSRSSSGISFFKTVVRGVVTEGESGREYDFKMRVTNGYNGVVKRTLKVYDMGDSTTYDNVTSHSLFSDDTRRQLSPVEKKQRLLVSGYVYSNGANQYIVADSITKL